jgi:hypothetical protein
MWFLWCNSFMFTFVLSRSIKLSFFCLKTLSIMTNFLNLNMLGYMFDINNLFLYLICMPIFKKTCLMFMLDGLLTKLSMHMPKFMTNGHHLFPYMLCMPIQKNNNLMICMVGFSLPNILMLGPFGLQIWFFC